MRETTLAPTILTLALLSSLALFGPEADGAASSSSTGEETSSDLDSAAFGASSTIDLDEDASAWRMSLQGDAHSELANVGAPSKDGLALKMSMLQSGADTSTSFHRDLSVRAPASLYTLSLSYKLDGQTTTTSMPDKQVSITVSRVQASNRYTMSLMWKQVPGDPSTGEWYYFDQDRANPWMPLYVSSAQPADWTSFSMDSEIKDGNFILKKLTLNGNQTKPLVSIRASAAPGESDSLRVAINLPGNEQKLDYALYVDELDLAMRK